MKKILFIMSAFIAMTSFSAFAADGRKWDGGKYPFRLLDPSKQNSENNPFIIDTAGKLAYFADLAKCEVDMEAFGKKNGLKGLRHAFKDNYVKLTADLDMNGSRYEFKTITGSSVNFDGGGHVLTNLRISDRTTPPYVNPDTGDAEITLGLFADVESVKNLGIGKGSSVTYYGVSKLTLKVYASALSVEAYRIDNCFSEASITVKGIGETQIGGITNACAYLTNSANRGPIVFEGDVIDSRAKNRGRRVTPGWFKIGGVCTVGGKTLKGCSNTGSITVRASGDDVQIGGVAADSNRSFCSDLINSANISVTATGDIKTASIGGVLGLNVPYPRNPKVRTEGYTDSGYIVNKGNIDVSVLTGKTISVGGVGGGLFDPSSSLTSVEFTGVFGYLNACNTGSVSASVSGKAELSVGGIVGSGAMVFNCYNAGRISGSSAAGGQLNLGGLGGADVYVQNSCNYGAVSGKGAGTNYVGGVIGFANRRWGEADREWYTSHNAFWLKSGRAGGVNSDIAYAKGSYYYKRQGDIPKEGLHQLLDAVDKKDPDKMVENDGAGFVYSFDSPSSAVMKRSDDGAGKRPNLSGTLLENLNALAEDRADRLYRRWIIDGSNGGYPVLSSKPTVFSRTSAKPDVATAALVAGQYKAVHRKWNDTMLFGADGSFKRATGGDGGTWSFDGKRLILRWTKWSPEILTQTAAGAFSCSAYSFTLTRPDAAAKPAAEAQAPASSGSSAAAPAASTQLSAAAKKIVGAYYAQHRDWTDALILAADGTFKREKGGESGTWSFDGRKLILKWSKTGTADTLVTTATGFACLAYKFTLRR